MDNKELEELFRAGLGDHRETPDPEVWNRIRSSLDKKKRTRVLPLWWRWGAAAAVLFGILFLVNPWEQDEVTPPAVTESGAEKESGKPEEFNSPALEEVLERRDPGDGLAGQDMAAPRSQEDTGAEGKVESPGGSRAEAPSGTQFSNPVEQRTVAQSEKADPPTTLAAPDPGQSGERANGMIAETKPGALPAAEQKTIPAPEPGTGAEAVAAAGVPEDQKKSIFEAVEEQEALAREAAPESKWTVGPTLAPVYFDSFGNGSPIDQNFVNNSKSGTVNMSYGLQVAYKVSRRISIRSGVHRVDYGYNTEDIGFTSSPGAGPSSLIRSISYSEDSRSLVVHSTAGGAQEPQQPEAVDILAPSPARQGQMVQEFGYLEIPVEMQYTLIDKKWGLHLIGGMSSLFLMNNSVSLESSGTITEIGESNTMNSLNFSTNLGLGVFYRLSQRLELNVQPMFKYQLNTFSQTEGSFRPYSVGVYSGLSFRF
jgi:hypothetical protein